jgi:hypothetical protein
MGQKPHLLLLSRAHHPVLNCLKNPTSKITIAACEFFLSALCSILFNFHSKYPQLKRSAVTDFTQAP